MSENKPVNTGKAPANNMNTVELTPEGKLKVIIGDNESIMTDEQTAAFFDKPNSPAFFYSLYLFKTNPEEAKHWVYLRLLEIEFIRTYLAMEEKKAKAKEEAEKKEEENNYGYNVEVVDESTHINHVADEDPNHIQFDLPTDNIQVVAD